MMEPESDSKESYQIARSYFERRMKLGVRPQIYCLIRLAGGEYLSPFTERSWAEYLAGWIAAGGDTK